MGIAQTIKAGRMAGDPITPQAIADFAKATWDDWRCALNRGEHERASELEAEFDALCALFQET
jgi:hypothetical protein